MLRRLGAEALRGRLGDSHDHLLALEQRVPNELACPQGYLRVGHVGGIVEALLE